MLAILSVVFIYNTYLKTGYSHSSAFLVLAISFRKGPPCVIRIEYFFSGSDI